MVSTTRIATTSRGVRAGARSRPRVVVMRPPSPTYAAHGIRDHPGPDPGDTRRERRLACVIELRSPAEIEQMRPAGRFVAEVLTRLEQAADVGVNLLELDALAHQMIKDRGAESCYIDYHPSFGASPFGKVLCTSVNDAVLHGLPHDYVLRDGDLVSLDFACSVDRWVADSAISLVVGTPRPEDLELIAVATRALEAGIAQARVGNRLFDISAAIGDTARAAGLSV